MRMAVTMLAAPLLALTLGVAPAQGADSITGSGVLIGTHGEILTNSHVVEDCQSITVQLPSNNSETAVSVTRDQKNDLAVIQINTHSTSVAAFREGTPLRAGDTVVALGYPLSGLLASTANVSVGNVSALAGLGDDSRYLQMSAPVQPGNSGGPLLDASGHIVGIVTAKLNATRVARFIGDIPQNVNFAIKAEVARTFLDSKGIAYRKLRSDQQLSPADVGDFARPFTVYIECDQAAPRSSAASTSSTPPLMESPTPRPPSNDPPVPSGVIPKPVHTLRVSPSGIQQIPPPRTEIPQTKKRLPAASVVEASQFQWQENDCKNSYCVYPSAYRFVLRNKTDYKLSRIKYVVIFYGPNGVPVHSIEGEFRGTLLSYLAKTLSSDLDGDAPYPGHEVRKIATSAEVRVLDYQISSKSSDLD